MNMNEKYKIDYSNQEERQKNQAVINQLRLIDDDFMSLFFDHNIECTQFVVRTILQRDDIDIIDVIAQKELKGIDEHSIRLDIMAKDKNEKLYDIEIQRSSKGAVAKRARYYSGMLERGLLKAGDDYQKLTDTYVIFITEKDHYSAGLPMYHIERCVKELGVDFEDGAHIIYVNGQYRGNDAIGTLMHDFTCRNADDMKNAVLAKRMHYFKISEGGYGNMCKLIDDRAREIAEKMVESIQDEIIEKTAKETAARVEKETTERIEKKSTKDVILKMVNFGHMTFEDIANILQMPVGEVEHLVNGA